MTPLLLAILGTVARAAGVWLSAWLVNRKFATPEQGEQLTGEIVTHVLLYAPVAASLIWGVLKNIRHRRAVLTALMPDVQTENQLNARLKSGDTPTVRTPPDTTPGVAVADLTSKE